MKKILIKIQTALLVAVYLGLAFGTEQVCASSFNLEVRESVAVVYTCFEIPDYGTVGFGFGTGFFVGDLKENPEYLVTNHHVIEDFLDFGAGEYTQVELTDGSVVTGQAKVRIYFSSDDYKEAYVVDYNETKDLAILKLTSPTQDRKAIALCSPTDEMIGSTVYAVGYPGLSDNIFVDAATSWGESDASVTTGTFSRLVTSAGTGIRRIQTDTVIQQGNSGGPMVNTNGSVIGINSMYVVSDAETNYYAISVDELIPMLNNNGVQYVMESDSKGISPTIIWIAVVAAVFVLLLVVILLLVFGKKKKKPVINMVQAAPPVQAFYPPKKAVIRSLSTQHNGICYPVGASPIMIGRDTINCAIVFREGTAGVSGRHCSVSWNEQADEFILTDLRSTYGTFLMNGQRLQPNIPYHLKPGESFYVGENINVLRVEVG